MLSFSTKQEFIQCAFETVAKIVSDQGQIALDAMTPAISTQRCLSHLELIEAFGEE